MTTILTTMLPETSKQKQTISWSQVGVSLVDSVVVAVPCVVVGGEAGNIDLKPETWTTLKMVFSTGLDPLATL